MTVKLDTMEPVLNYPAAALVKEKTFKNTVLKWRM